MNDPSAWYVQLLAFAEFSQIRRNADKRNDFLGELARESRTEIAFIAKQFIGIRATRTIIQGEATQQFLLRANRAIDSASLTDDGRYKNNPRLWCKFKGLGGVKDWARNAYGTRVRNVAKYELEQHTFYIEDYLDHHRPDRKHDLDPGVLYRDDRDYQSLITSSLVVQEFLTTLERQDRSIVELLVFGETTDEKVRERNGISTIRSAGEYGARTHRILQDIAHTIGTSESFVYTRVREMRTLVAQAWPEETKALVGASS